MPSMYRALRFLIALLLGCAVPAVATAAPSSARDDHEPKIFTWNDDPAVDGFGDGLWSKDTNWEPQGVPQDGDIVIIEGDPDDQWVIQGIPDIELRRLRIEGSPGVRLLRGDRITVTERMSLSGGVGLEIDVVVAPTAVADIQLAENPACHGGRTRCAEIGQDSTLTVQGSLDLVATEDPADLSELMLWGNSDITIAPGGRMTTIGDASVHSALCCSTGMSVISNHGTVAVTGAGLTTDHVDVDNTGTVTVDPGSRWVHQGGGFRSAGATYGGGGLVDVVASGPVRSDAAEPGVRDGTFEVADSLTVADATLLRLGDVVDVTGTGTVDGAGSVRLAGPDLRAHVTFGPALDLATTAGTTTRQRAHHTQLPGFHGDVTFAGGVDVVNGSTYMFDAGTVAEVPATQVFAVRRGGVVTASSCCNTPAVLRVDPNATLQVGSDGGDEQAVFEQVRLENPGRTELHNDVRWRPAPAVFSASSQVLGWGRVEGDLLTGPAAVQSMQHLVVTGNLTMGEGGRLRTVVLPRADLPRVATTIAVGGTFLADGLLHTEGRTTHARDTAVDVVTAARLDGAFDCVRAPGWHPTSTGTTLTLTADGTYFSRCVHESPAPLLSGPQTGTRTFVAPGHPEAKWVQLRVTVSGATKATTLEVGSGATGAQRITVPQGAAKTVAVIVPFHQGRPELAATLRAGRADVDVAQVAAYVVRPAADPTSTGTITGRLTVAGAAPKKVRVEVWKEPGDATDGSVEEAATYPFDWVETDRQGNFTLTGLPVGDYRIAVEHGLAVAWHENWLNGVDRRDQSPIVTIDSVGETVRRDFTGYRYGSRAELTVRATRARGTATVAVRVAGAHATTPRGKVAISYLARRRGGGTATVSRVVRLERGAATLRVRDAARGRRAFVATYRGTTSHWSDKDRARARIR